MTHDFVNYFYLVTAVMFIAALRMMNSPRTARAGNAVAAVGMLLAIVGTLVHRQVTWTWIVTGLAIGSAIGAYLALRVRMTAVPQLVSFFNGSGGLAAGLVAMSHYWALPHETSGTMSVVTSIAAIVGWVSFTGSMIAVGKLQGWLKGRPLLLPGGHLATATLLGLLVAGTVMIGLYPQWWWVLIPITVLAAGFGVSMVLPIGGADMPVVIALLNSFTGLAAAATGFLLSNTGLIISGALVGASGSILTHLMCQAMNRPLGHVLFGALGAGGATAAAAEKRTVRNYTVQDAQMVLENAASVVIVPGYGLAAAQAHYAVKDLGDVLESRGISVKYAIHPVAGRMPGHMNVLLAEANVPYDHLLDLEQGNSELDHADVALVVGANDVTNPIARTDSGSPIYGMPILNVDHARTVIVTKRSMGAGFAGIDNPLFYDDKTMMIFGDAKKTFTDLLAAMGKK